jgi:peptide/nickel transport system permease protein
MNRFFAGIKKRPTALVSFIILVVLYLSMIFAEFISPYDPTTTFPDHTFHPPNFTLFSDKYGFGPQVQKYVLLNPRTWEYARVKGEYYRVGFFVRGPEYKLMGFIPLNIHLFGTETPYVEGGDRKSVV